MSIVTTIFPEYSWVMELLGEEAGSQDITFLLDHEEIVEGMEAEAEEEHEEIETAEAPDGGQEAEASGEEPEYDEHVWLSVKNAKVLCGVIAEAFIQLDPEHAQEYQENAAVYDEKLSALDQAYQSAVDTTKGDTILFGDRFPFRYLADDLYRRTFRLG